jgi:hypothetical protein
MSGDDRPARTTMRKIVSGLFITLDGVIEAPQKWNPPYYNDEMTEAVQHSSPAPTSTCTAGAPMSCSARCSPARTPPARGDDDQRAEGCRGHTRWWWAPADASSTS